MQDKLRKLARLRDTRQRLRDMAAADAGDAERERFARQQLHAQKQDELGALHDEAVTRMQHAGSIRDLEMLATELGAAEVAAVHADQLVDEACEVAEKALDVLRSKERDLRISEKLLTVARDENSRAVDKTEQTLTDDISASKWRMA